MTRSTPLPHSTAAEIPTRCMPSISIARRKKSHRFRPMAAASGGSAGHPLERMGPSTPKPATAPGSGQGAVLGHGAGAFAQGSATQGLVHADQSRMDHQARSGYEYDAGRVSE